MGVAIETERIVMERYTDTATMRREELCCPVTYDHRYLEVIPTKSRSAITAAATISIRARRRSGAGSRVRKR